MSDKLIDFPSKQDLCDEIDRLVIQRDEARAHLAELIKHLRLLCISYGLIGADTILKHIKKYDEWKGRQG